MYMTIKNEGILLVLSSPSGAGKTTISEKLLKCSTDLVRSISVTTRKPRFHEVDKIDYFFVTQEEFNELCQKDQMLEYAEVFGNWYGIPRNFIEKNIQNGISVLLTIDWQGALHLFKIMKEKIVSIFILPPSMQELRSRLNNRNSDSSSVIESRLAEAKKEISKYEQYDYIIVNNDVNRSVEDIDCILKAERLKVSRKIDIKNFVNDMSFYS
ncbi:MAG: guanylate kinase [Wolbachia endosymbiont of Fragariocoptes setiger]|nr:guanylate kinase [Wolbachia endosymbiont of Fragariocoptes setiger]